MRQESIVTALALTALLAAAPAAEAQAPRTGRVEAASATAASDATDAAANATAAREALALLVRWQPAAARGMLEPAKAASATSADLRAAWGLLRAEEGARDEALATLAAAEALDATAAAPAYYRGEVLLQQDRYDDAKGAWAIAADRAAKRLQSQPEDAAAAYVLGAARVRLKQFATAREALAKARAAGFDPAQVSYQVGLSYAFDAKWKDAERELSAALAAAPDLAHGYYYRGIANDKMGKKDQAFKDFERFLQLAPSAPEAPKVQTLLGSLH